MKPLDSGTPRARIILVCALSLSAGLFAQAGAPQAPLAEPTGGSTVSFAIDSRPRKAAVEINGRYVGATPLDVTNYPPGSYLVELSMAGRRTVSYSVNAVPGTRYVISAELPPLLGFLDVDVEPESAQILIDGEPGARGLIALPVGIHRVSARLFGYETQEQTVSINQYLPLSARFVLAKAAFSLSRPSFSRPRFNPANAGPLGTTVLSFAVSAPGSGRMRIEAVDGTVVAEAEYPNFSDWDQSFRWSGRDASGAILPEGSYTARIEASGQDGIAATASAVSMIDASALILCRDFSGGVSGFALCPDARVLPPGSVEIRLGAACPLTTDYPNATLPFWAGTRLSLVEALEAVFSMTVAAGPGRVGGTVAGASIKYQFSGMRRSDILDAALYLQGLAAMPGSVAGLNPADGESGLRLGLPVGVSEGAFDASLCPQASISFANLSAPTFRLGLSAAAGLQYPGFDVHLSASSGLDLNRLAFDSPVRTAIDARVLLGKVPVSLGLGAGLDIGSGGGLSARIMASLGIID
jgi:hypothetical protein